MYSFFVRPLSTCTCTLTTQCRMRESVCDCFVCVNLQEHDCKLTREIVELVDREADLLVRGTGEDALQGLRKRIATLFLQYCKTPLFNAEAAKYIKVGHGGW